MHSIIVGHQLVSFPFFLFTEHNVPSKDMWQCLFMSIICHKWQLTQMTTSIEIIEVVKNE